MTEQEVHPEPQKEQVVVVENTKPRKRSTRSIEYYIVIEVNSRYMVETSVVKDIVDTVIGDVVRFVSLPLRQKNAFFVYTRRGAKKRIYKKVLTGLHGKTPYKCTFIDLKKGDEEDVIKSLC